VEYLLLVIVSVGMTVFGVFFLAMRFLGIKLPQYAAAWCAVTAVLLGFVAPRYFMSWLGAKNAAILLGMLAISAACILGFITARSLAQTTGEMPQEEPANAEWLSQSLGTQQESPDQPLSATDDSFGMTAEEVTEQQSGAAEEKWLQEEQATALAAATEIEEDAEADTTEETIPVVCETGAPGEIVPAFTDLDEALEFAFTAREEQNVDLAYEALEAAKGLCGNELAAWNFLEVEQINLLYRSGQYETALTRLFALQDSLRVWESPQTLTWQQQVHDIIGHILIICRVLAAEGMDKIPLAQLPESVRQTIEEEYRQWRHP